MTTIASIILSAFMGLSQNAGYTGISGIQCSSGFSTITKNIAKLAGRANPWIGGIITAVEIGEFVADYLSDNSENTAQEEDNTPENPQTSASESNYNGQNESNDDLENWHKDFQPDNDKEQDDSKVSQTSKKRKQTGRKKASRKNRRSQIDQLPLPERESQSDEIEVAVLGEGDYDLLY